MFTFFFFFYTAQLLFMYACRWFKLVCKHLKISLKFHNLGPYNFSICLRKDLDPETTILKKESLLLGCLKFREHFLNLFYNVTIYTALAPCIWPLDYQWCFRKPPPPKQNRIDIKRSHQSHNAFTEVQYWELKSLSLWHKWSHRLFWQKNNFYL